MKIAIASGKGGTGKTFVATNIFYTLKKAKYETVLVDCDAEEPNSAAFFDARVVEQKEVTQLVPVINTDKCTFCGRCSEYCSYNAIFIVPGMKVIRVMEELCHGCGACSVACNDGAITEKQVSLGMMNKFSGNGEYLLYEAKMNVGVMSPVPVIKEAIKETDGIDGIVIMDSPPGTSCPFIQTVASADYVVLVTEPTPFGLSDLRQSVETLKTMGKPFGVVINRAGMGNDGVGKYLIEEKIDHLLDIPFSREIARLYSEGRIVSASDTRLAKQLEELTQKIIFQYGTGSDKR